MSQQPKGFTIIEVMIAIVILALVMAIGVPSFVDFTRNRAVEDAATRWLADINAARAASISRSSLVTMCPFNTGTNTCSATGSCNCTTGTANFVWDTGWIAFVNADDDWQFSQAAGDVLLLAADGFEDNITLRSSQRAGRRFSFAPTGMLDGTDWPGFAGIACYNNSSADYACKATVISAGGSSRQFTIDKGDSTTPGYYEP